MNTVGKVVLIGTGAFATYYVVGLLSKGKAGDQLETNLAGFKFLDINIKGLNTWIKYRATIAITNPTSEKLSFTTPYIRMFIKDKLICKSAIVDKINVLEPKKTLDDLTIDLEFRAKDVASVIPNILNFLKGRIKGEPASQEVKIVYSYESEGFGQEITKKVLI